MFDLFRSIRHFTSSNPTFPKSNPDSVNVLLYSSVILLMILAPWNGASAGLPEYFSENKDRAFFLGAGLGYGVSNQPFYNSTSGNSVGGVTLSASLGYRFNRRFSLDFGPSFWIEGKDAFDNSAQNNERPSNKRTIICLNGYVRPFERMPVHLKAGIGVGTLVFTPRKQVVFADRNGISETEITGGFAANFAFIYEWKLSEKMTLYPSAGLWYLSLDEQKIKYATEINDSRSSLTGDLRLNVRMSF